jgi:hypothetical protein
VVKYPAAVLLIPALLGTLHNGAVACSCNLPAPVVIEFADADAVFFGKIVSEWTDEDGDPVWRYLKIRVEKSWRGVTGTEAGLVTDPVRSTCAIEAVVGDEVLVYAGEVPDGSRMLYVDWCSRMLTGSDAWEDRSEFTRLGLEPLELTDGPDPVYTPKENPAKSPVESVANPCGSGMLPALITLSAALSALRGWRLTWRRFTGAQRF